jgi:glycosyltransferase involved in cell wall biosynthesis
VSPSLTEGFGLALLEAMACKVPVIATDCPGGQREIIKAGECGLLVPPASETHLADAIVKMLTDTELRSRYVNAGLKRVEDFDPTRFQECYLSLLAPLRGAGL